MSNSRIVSIIITIIFVMASKGVFKSLFKGKDKTVDNGEAKVMQTESISLKPSRFKEAYDLWRGGNPREALVILKETSLSDLSSLILLGEIYLELKEVDLADKAFKKSLTKGQTAFAYSRLGEILEMNELYNEAIKLYKKALRCKDVEKGYVYHKLGNLYMYTGLEEKSDKTFEIAEKYHAEGSSTKLFYDFTSKSNGSNKTPPVAIFVVLATVFIIALCSFIVISFIAVDTEEVSVYLEEAVNEEVVLNSENDTTTVEVEVVDSLLGNTNSNITYGGKIVASDSYVYSFNENTIVKTNELTGETEDITNAFNVNNFNIIEDKLFYIEYNHADSSVISYDLLKDEIEIYTAKYPWNLLVDESDMFYIEDGDVQMLTVQSYRGKGKIEIEIDNVWLFNQSAGALFFLKDNMIYSIKKSMLSNGMDLFAEATILNDSNIVDMTLEEDYIFFVVGDDENIYKMNLDGTRVVSIISGYDYNTMTLNVNKSDVFVGIDEGDTIYTDVYSVDGEYLYTIDDIIGNHVSNEFIYWYPSE